MAGIRRSASILTVTAVCGHRVLVLVPGGTTTDRPGPVGEKRIAEAQETPCAACTNINHGNGAGG